ncbi:WD40 repeat-like protein [Violaceomyces palustris]|uniref:WD40 repeat-like protein n=1 Tax=Violaceomyces palustris TaxID=1673888 RepID=A0ACD0NMF6_9BASI|nr:WD40 repeat-like protein [Violaceomyces palustris]
MTNSIFLSSPYIFPHTPTRNLASTRTRGREWIDTSPSIIPAKVSIHHLELRDLLQPSGVKGKVLFVNKYKIEQADFNSFSLLITAVVTVIIIIISIIKPQHHHLLKTPSTYCTLDFLPNCLTTGALAGGISDSERMPAPWLLRTPTGGSINNSISIQPDISEGAMSKGSAYSPRRTSQPPRHINQARDEPREATLRRYLLFGQDGRLETNEMEREREHEEVAATYGYDTPAPARRSIRDPSDGFRVYEALPQGPEGVLAGPASVRLMVSNNDKSIKAYKLRPPSGCPGAGGRIESGLPGLSRTNTLQFPTAINHSSFSPDQSSLLAVGDTSEVFLYSVTRAGDFTRVATYESPDASFSTSWSPDGMKFAVASQDGTVSVWDVRSSKKLANLHTSQGGYPGTSGAARVVKFSPHGDMLAYTEHRNYFHITDTISFSESQRIAVPSASSVSEHNASAQTSGHIHHLSSGQSPGSTTIISPVYAPVSQERNGLDSQMTSIEGAYTSPDEYGDPIGIRGGEGTLGSLVRDRGGGATVSVSVGAGILDGAGSSDRERRTTAYMNFLNREEILMRPGTRTLGQIVVDWSSHMNGNAPSVGTVRREEVASRESSINVSGLCWDPDGEFIYCSTERLVARYCVIDSRQGCPHGDLI